MSYMQKKKSKPKQDQKKAAELDEEEKKAAKKEEGKKAAEKAEEEKKAAIIKEAKKEQKLGESSATFAKATAKTEDGRSSSAKGAITLAKDKHKSLKLPEIMTFFRTASDKEEELCSIETEIDFQTRPGTVIALKAGEEALNTTESVMNLLESSSCKIGEKAYTDKNPHFVRKEWQIVNTQGQQSIKHTYICKTKGVVLVHHVGDYNNEETYHMQASTSTRANSEQKHVSSSDTEEEISLPTLADVEGVNSEQYQPKAAQPYPAGAAPKLKLTLPGAHQLPNNPDAEVQIIKIVGPVPRQPIAFEWKPGQLQITARPRTQAELVDDHCRLSDILYFTRRINEDMAYVRTTEEKIMEANRLQRREEEWANRHTPEGLALEQRRQAMLARFCPEDVGLIQGPVNPHPEIPDHQAANPPLNYAPLPHGDPYYESENDGAGESSPDSGMSELEDPIFDGGPRIVYPQNEGRPWLKK